MKFDNVLVIKKKPRDGQLDQEDQRENANISSIRSLIELVFADLVNKFKVLDNRGGFDGKPENFMT